MSVRPTEVRKIAAMLSEPADSVDDLARDVVNAINEMWMARTQYVLIVRDPALSDYVVWGMFDTENQAKRAIGKHITAIREGARYALYRVLKVGESEAEAD